MRFLLQFIGVALTSLVSTGAAAAESSLCVRIQLPVPKATYQHSSMHTFVREERAVEATITVDTAGRVADVSIDSTTDSLTAAAVVPWLKQFEFEPGRRDSQTVLMSMSVAVLLPALPNQPFVVFPQRSDGAVINYELYRRSLALQGINLARLSLFPSYFFRIKPDDSTMPEPLAILDLDIDERGKVRDRRIVSSSVQRFTSQLEDAALWSNWQPASVDNVKQPATARLVIRMIPQLSYPTMPFRTTSPDTLTAASRFRVQASACEATLLSPPVPRPGASLEDYVKLKRHPVKRQVIVKLMVDSAGRTTVLGGKNFATLIGQKEGVMAKAIDFYPGLSWAGTPVRCFGYAVITFSYDYPSTVKYYWSSMAARPADVSDSSSIH